MKNIMIKKVQENELSEMIKEADAYELFTSKGNVQCSKEIKEELKNRPLPKDQSFNTIFLHFYTCGRGKYAAIYIVETITEEVINTEVSDLIEERTSYYVHGLKTRVHSRFDWSVNSQWRDRIILSSVGFGNKYHVGVQTTSYSNNSIEFVEKVVNDLQKSVAKAKEVREYLQKNDMLAMDED